MPDDSSYEIVPYKEIVLLKKQIEELRGQSQDTPSKDLLKSMNELSQNMSSMLQYFKMAAEELKIEEKEGEGITKQIDPIMQKLDQILEQNKTIAEGMVSIADMMKEMKPGQGTQNQAPQPQFSQQPMFPPPQMMGNEQEPMMPDMSMPPIGSITVDRVEPRFSRNRAPEPMMPPQRQNNFMPNNNPSMQNNNFFGPGQAGMPAGPIPGVADFPPLGPIPEAPKKKGLMGMFKK